MLAERLYENNNFQSLELILSGLHHGAVMRLRKTIKLLPSWAKKSMEGLTTFMAQFKSFRLYRIKLNKRISSSEPCIPNFDIIFRDCLFADESPNFVCNDNRFLNFNKAIWIGNYISNIKKLMQREYPLNHQDETIRCRTIRKYIQNIYNNGVKVHEDELYKLSYQWEPMAKMVA